MLVVQIVVAVLLAPTLAGETWAPNPLMLATLAISLAVVALGTRSLASSPAVESTMATDEPGADEAVPARSSPRERAVVSR
ncbi:MAG: hypothetical protein ACR2LH_00235 [Thermoleophilaceae bacterium]